MRNMCRYNVIILLALVASIFAPLSIVATATPVSAAEEKPTGIVDYAKIAPLDKDRILKGPEAPIYAIVNKSGTTERNGVVQVRLDLCLGKGAYRYDDSRFYIVDTSSAAYLAGFTGDESDYKAYETWLDSLPHKWAEHRVFHTHFIYLDPYDYSQSNIEAAMALHLPNFYQAWLEGWDMVRCGMRHGFDVATRIRPPRYDDFQRELTCLSIVNAIALEPVTLKGDVVGKLFPSTDIDVGAAATDRASLFSIYTYTVVCVDNSANNTGTIDTVEIWLAHSADDDDNGGLWFGTFSDGGSNVLTCHDSESVGTCASGSKQSFTGLDINISTGEYIGADFRGSDTGVNIERDTTGGSGMWYYTSDVIDPDDSATFVLMAGYQISLYGTGDTDEVITAPTITTLNATNVANTTAQLNAYVNSSGNETSDVRFEYGNSTLNYTDSTAWVNDTYDTGAYPYAELTNLTASTDYFYRAAIANSNSTAYGAEISFTTASSATEAISLTAIVNDDAVSLSWVRGVGATNTLIRGKLGAYPSSTSDGVLVYLGTGNTATHDDLVEGRTYYYSAWGESGGGYSTNYTTVLASTGIASSTVTEVPDNPSAPSTWWTTIDVTRLDGLPLYDEFDGVITDYGVQAATAWTFIILAIVLVITAATFGATDGNIMVTGLAAAFLMLAFSLLHLLPMYFMGISIVMFISLASVRERI